MRVEAYSEVTAYPQCANCGAELGPIDADSIPEVSIHAFSNPFFPPGYEPLTLTCECGAQTDLIRNGAVQTSVRFKVGTRYPIGTRIGKEVTNE